MSNKRTQQQRRELAQKQVLESATHIFAERGFQEASLEEIAEHGGLTIRPIYHYFGSKKGLFTAVTEQLESQLTEHFQQAINDNPHSLIAGWYAFIEQSQDKAFRQIVLIDAPNVLGRDRWHDSPVVHLAQQTLTPYLPNSPAHVLLISRMLLVALAEAALVIAENESGEFITAANELVAALLAQFESTKIAH